MKLEINKIIKRANESLEAARKLFNEGYYNISASRAYYTVFYMAEAVLLTKGLTFSKHSGVISAFGQYFIKEGLIQNKYHQILRDAFRARNIGDYNYEVDISMDEADKILKKAEDFFDEMKNYLKREGHI